ncbi:MAG: hypothetical protein IKB86_05795 [Clostridia bacterium]|nr:hypothetical protein [Clostridia bacterium]
MWYGRREKNGISVNDNGKEKMYFISDCRDVAKYEDRFYFLTRHSIFCGKDGKILFAEPLASTDADLIKVHGEIYVSSCDTGTIYQFSDCARPIQAAKIGEHVSDFAVLENKIYCVTFHDNKLVKLSDFKIEKEVALPSTPQRIIVKNRVFVLVNDGFFSKIMSFDRELNFIREIIFPRQIGDILYFSGKIIFSGLDFNYILTEKLTVLSTKKSTGKILCSCADSPIILDDKVYSLDLTNNIIYPS